jgi:hypothetical protein
MAKGGRRDSRFTLPQSSTGVEQSVLIQSVYIWQCPNIAVFTTLLSQQRVLGAIMTNDATIT